jgi:hypothetical protein
MKFQVGDIIGKKDLKGSTYVVLEIDYQTEQYHVKFHDINTTTWTSEFYVISAEYVKKGSVVHIDEEML